MPTDLGFFFRVLLETLPPFFMLVGLAGLGLFGAEYLRLLDSRIAFVSTRAWMTGWGVTIAVRIVIGVVTIGLWMIWAWL